MKRFTSIAAVSVLAFASAVALAAPASASCWFCPSSDSSTFGYGAGGEISNNGNGYGSLAGSQSDTSKNVYGAGDSTSNTGSDSAADSYAGAHFTTAGKSFGASLKFGGTAKAGSEEHGSVVGDGMAQTTESWGSLTKTRESTFGFGAGGDAVNKGKASGDVSWADSVTTKKVYGGGDAVSNTNGSNGANAYSGSLMATHGSAGAKSFGTGSQSAGSNEYGMVGGGGGTTAGTSTGYSYGN